MLQTIITNTEFNELRAEEILRPRGYDFAIVAATIANAHRDPKKRAAPFTADDFIPEWREIPIMSDGELQQTLKALTAGAGGNVV